MTYFHGLVGLFIIYMLCAVFGIVETAGKELSILQAQGCESQELYFRCPYSTYLDIVDVEYGRRLPSSVICPYQHLPQYKSSNKPWSEDLTCVYHKALEVVQESCQERRVCRIKATDRTFYPDPCPNTGKYLVINYRCVPSPRYTETECEGKSLSLNCDKGKRLYITSAQYGYDGLIPQMCLILPSTAEKPLGCLSSTAEEIVKNRCHSKRSCTITADEATFGSFCSEVGKYLKISYVCVPKRIIKPDGTLLGENEVEELLSDEGSIRNLPSPSTSLTLPVSNDSPNSVNLPELSNPNSEFSPDNDDCNCTGDLAEIPDHMHSQKDPSLVFGWVHSISYINENREKLILYGVLCGCLAFIAALVVLIVRMYYVRRRRGRQLHNHQKLNVTEPIQDTSNEENTYIAAGDPSDVALLQYNLSYNREPINRLNSAPGSYRGSHSASRYNDPDTNRYNTNSLTVGNPLHSDNRRNFNNSPHTTASTALNNSPLAANVDHRNTFYENSGDDEHTNDDNDAVVTNSQILYSHPVAGQDVRPRTNSLFDRHS